MEALAGLRGARRLAALAGCVAVGPDYLRPAAIVPSQYKEIKGWKISHAARRCAEGRMVAAFPRSRNSIFSRRRWRSPTRP